MIGYLPIAAAYGIMAKATGITLLETFLFSALVFAGASQFMALNLLAVGAGAGEIVIATFLVNFRHFIMSASLTTKLSKKLRKCFPLIAFGVTDEIFSVLSFTEGKISRDYILSLQLAVYLAWLIGTILGYLAGGALPSALNECMGISLYAMFAAILIPEAKKSTKVMILAILSGFVNSFLNYWHFLSPGWNIIIAIILVSGLGVYIFNEDVSMGE